MFISYSAKVSLVAQMVKNLLAMQETQVQFLGQEDPLEKRLATHSSIFAWRIPWTEEPGGLPSTGSQRVGHNGVTSLHFFSRGTSQPKDQTLVSCIAGRFFTAEPQGSCGS